MACACRPTFRGDAPLIDRRAAPRRSLLVPGGDVDEGLARPSLRRGRFTRSFVLALIVLVWTPAGAGAEQASQPGSAAAAQLDVGRHHSCAVLGGGSVRCWGYGAQGQLGYADVASIGDDEVPASVAAVDLGPGRRAAAIATGDFHTCALLDDGNVRCWGFGADGRLGYGDTQNVGDDESPGAIEPVDLGEGRTATAISAGMGHTCVVLDDGSVRCWGYGENGALGYADTASIGDDEPPGSVGPVNLGAGRTATAISAGGDFTCVVLDDGTVRCWGLALDGRLGYGNTERIGDDETPGSVGPIDIGAQRTATAISAGMRGTCALLDDKTVRCWGEGREGALGYANGQYVGDNETPGSVGPVDLGSPGGATAISAGRHTCAVLDLGSVRCWGASTKGQLGYGNTERIGDTETPGSVGPVHLGPQRAATAISAGELHTCARLDDHSVRCWGYAANGRLGLCNERDVGDDELPSSVGPVDLGQPDILTDGCPIAPLPPTGAPVLLPQPTGPAAPLEPAIEAPARAPSALDVALARQSTRARALRSCLRRVSRALTAGRRRARRLPSRTRRRLALRRLEQRATRGRRACLRRHGRVPGRVSRLLARGQRGGKIRLTFRVVGTDGRNAPAARSYVIKQSRRPIRTRRDFVRAHSLCKGTCSFDVTAVGTTATLTVTDLSRHRLYYYAIAARDNVSGRTGPRSRAVIARAR